MSTHQAPGRWPDTSQRLLLDAALADGEPALRAWHQWHADHPLDSADRASHFLLPLVYANLSRLDARIPALSKLRQFYRQTWMLNELRKRGLLELVDRLHSAGIDALPLKGIALAMFHYGDLGVRTMGDIDLVVPDLDVDRTAKVMSRCGWRPRRTMPDRRFRPFIHAIAWNHPRWQTLDLHWHPFMIDCPPECTRLLWRNAVSHEIHGSALRVPDPTDMLLLTCFHGRKPDVQSACRWVADLVTLIRQNGPHVAWNQIPDRAQRYGVLLPVRDALRYVRREFDVPVPESLLDQLAAVAVTRADVQRYRLLVKPSRHTSLRDILGTHWWRYCAGCRATGRTRNPVAFARYLWSYSRLRFEHESPWQRARNALIDQTSQPPAAAS